ncbi:P2Y purinoceptor 14-like [Plectropomus leopardus]|uniref:P2Y purinoceptor 14-like n=1 Tax=Plectropomus leopardus TaxID=160734 RepID=UPI001C4D082F|nr:P2Y purinoceptor 14-like [Plectropomus leopardus]
MDRAGEEPTGPTNQTEFNSSTTCEWDRTSANPFFMVVLSLVFLVGLLLNGFIIKFYLCRAEQKASSSMMVYLKNLAAADFLLCLSLPIRIIQYASNSVTIRLLNCNFGVAILYLNMYASIMFMGYIAANRYLKVVRHSGTHILQTLRAAYIVSTVTWVFLLTVMSAYVILSFTQKPLTSVPVSCDYLLGGRFTVFFKIIHACSTALFLFVLASLFFFYYSTSRRVSQAQQRQPASSSSTKLARSRRNMLVLVSVFSFCFIPYHLVRLPKVFLGRHCSWDKILFYMMELTIIMSVLNVCLDPLIYFILCKKFRTQFRLRGLCGNS